MDYVLDVHQSYPFYQDRETKKLARTSCWYVPGRVVRMSSALLVGPFENKQMCHSSSRHPLYFIIARTCLLLPQLYPFQYDKRSKKTLQEVLLECPRTCSRDVLRTSFRDVLRVIVTK